MGDNHEGKRKEFARRRGGEDDSYRRSGKRIKRVNLWLGLAGTEKYAITLRKG